CHKNCFLSPSSVTITFSSYSGRFTADCVMMRYKLSSWKSCDVGIFPHKVYLMIPEISVGKGLLKYQFLLWMFVIKGK
ncbi:MAG: hypothetical protein ACKPA7_07050, partial [Sphaerospermopsis kisseleviana]